MKSMPNYVWLVEIVAVDGKWHDDKTNVTKSKMVTCYVKGAATTKIYFFLHAVFFHAHSLFDMDTYGKNIMKQSFRT